MSAKGHVWTAPGWQELFSRLQPWSVQPCVRRVRAAHAAGHNALRGSGPGQIQDTAIAMSALPPKADMCSAARDVRFGPKADIARFHLITSSARASSVGGTVRPSALAVLRLITSSYLVGACTGRLAGFSPLRMRST